MMKNVFIFLDGHLQLHPVPLTEELKAYLRITQLLMEASR